MHVPGISDKRNITQGGSYPLTAGEMRLGKEVTYMKYVTFLSAPKSQDPMEVFEPESTWEFLLLDNVFRRLQGRKGVLRPNFPIYCGLPSLVDRKGEGIY